MNFKLISAAVSIAISAAAAQDSSEPNVTQIEATSIAEEIADSSSVVPVPATETTETAPEATETAEIVPEANTPATELAQEKTSEQVSNSEATNNSDKSTLATESTTKPEEVSTTNSSTFHANFDVLRGRTYNTVGNQAAAYTIDDKIGKPYTMHGSKLVYLEPTLEYAAVAFGESNTYFLSFQNTSGNLGLVTAGFANSGFGVELYAAIGKTWEIRTEPNRDYNEDNVSLGDNIGAVFSMPLGSIDLTVSANWVTTNNETYTNSDTQTPDLLVIREQDYWDVNAKVAISNSPATQATFSWAAGLSFLRHNRTETSTNNDEITEASTLDSRIELAPFLNLGMPILQANNARVFLGLNTSIPIGIYDNIENDSYYIRRNHFGLSIVTTPNIFAELALDDHWMVFGGANYTWNVFSTEYAYEKDADRYAFGMKSSIIAVNAGARFQYKNFAIEVSLNDAFFNNPLLGFGGSAFLARFGGFIHF